MSESEDTVANPPSGSGFLRSEDFAAVLVAFLLIVAGAVIHFRRPTEEISAKFDDLNAKLASERSAAGFRTLEWHDANDEKGKVKATADPDAKKISSWFPKLQKWGSNPVESFLLDETSAKAKAEAAQGRVSKAKSESDSSRAIAQTAQEVAKAANFQNAELNDGADQRIKEFRAVESKHKAAKKKAKVKAYNQFGKLAVFGVIAAIVLALGLRCIGQSAKAFLAGFGAVYVLAILAYVIAAQADLKAAGFGYAAWAIILGLLISNTVGTPKWVKPAVQTEYFIKIGLVLLGVEILFGKVLVIGLPGIFVAWVVTPIVFVVTYLIGQHFLKITSKSLNLTLSADMSVCGVSAAIATAAACRAKKEELTLAVGISLVFTSIMMVVLPNVIQMLGMDPVLGGAWIGGTIDATGAVAAAGAFLGDQALYVAATIKMIQNILIGVIAFFVAVYWVTRVERTEGAPKPSAWEIWNRFPKFVLGFLVISIVFSLVYESLGSDLGETLISNGMIKGWTKSLRGWFFCLAFVSIGLATNFRELKSYLSGGRPVVLYLIGQTINLALTLGVAYLMFRVVFEDVSASL
ncbi:MAG: putative sulfate exporter family transporter [Planctomycetota bacterium]